MTSKAPTSPARAGTSMRPAVLLAIACLGLAAACGSARAKQSDRSQPVQATAKSADATATPNGVSHLKGDVVITQGTLKITSDDATIHFDGQSQVKRVVLDGKAHIQQMDDNGNLMSGDAEHIDYDIPKGIAILEGHPARVKQAGRADVSAERLVYDTRTSQMSGQSQGDQRVHLTFKAQQQPAAAASAPAPAKPGN